MKKMNFFSKKLRDDYFFINCIYRASPLVKKIYSVEFNRRKDLIKLQKDEAIKLVQRHANDRGSREANGM